MTEECKHKPGQQCICDDEHCTQCAFCPVKGGALKPAAVAPGAEPQWVHLFCSQWIPETYIKSGDTERMEPVQGVPNVGKPRRNLVCAVCKTKSGACIQCNHGFLLTMALAPLLHRANRTMRGHMYVL